MSRVILASASPRRHELLRELIPNFEIAAADVDEEPIEGESPEETAERLARWKAAEIAGPDTYVIAGDTVVALGELQLAKPTSPEDAAHMLQTLSGCEHRVITGLCLATPQGEKYSALDTTWVRFRPLSSEEIERYVASGEPMDKAGAYAIQGGASGFVTEIRGSRSNVIGLPLEALRELLRSHAPELLKA